MSTPPATPSWPYCAHGADPATDPVGCRGIHVPGHTACLAHLTDADRDTYLAGLTPGANVDHRAPPSPIPPSPPYSTPSVTPQPVAPLRRRPVRGGGLRGHRLVPFGDRAAGSLGKAHPDGGVGARLRNHLGHPERSRVFTRVFVVAADPFCPPRAIEAAEGRAADLIGLRGRMGPRTWPVFTEVRWLALLTSHPASRVGRPRPAGDDSGDRSATPA